jgi:hypothetical protein
LILLKVAVGKSWRKKFLVPVFFSGGRKKKNGTKTLPTSFFREKTDKNNLAQGKKKNGKPLEK